MSELIFIGEKSPEGRFVAKSVSASIFTQADSIEKRIIKLQAIQEEIIAA